MHGRVPQEEPPDIPAKSRCRRVNMESVNARGTVSKQNIWEIEELTEGGMFWKARGKALEVQGWC